MKIQDPRRVALLVALFATAGAGLAASAEEPAAAVAAAPPSAPAAASTEKPKSVFQDPEWRARFLGSYGFLSGAEPEISPRELDLLREVIDLMQANPRAAAARLTGEVGPQSSAALDFILANLQFQNGDLDAAVTSYESALKKFPDFRRAHKNLGLLHVQRGELPLAVPHLSRAIELGDRDGRNYGLLGFAYLDQENYIAAEQAYRSAILQEPETKDWQLGLARSLLAQEKYLDAASLFETLLAADPNDTTVWMLQANAYVGLDRPLDAAVDLEAVRALGKAQTSSLTLLGDIYMNAGMYELAKSAYQEVIRSDEKGTQFPTAYRAAELLIRTRSYGEAQQLLASIDRRYTDLPAEDELEVLTLKAKLARGQGRAQEAAPLLESIVERDGTRGDALLELADYYKEKGDAERALLMVERAEKIEAYEHQALLVRAELLVAARDYAQAAEVLRRALEIKPEPRVEQFLARVEDAARG